MTVRGHHPTSKGFVALARLLARFGELCYLGDPKPVSPLGFERTSHTLKGLLVTRGYGRP